MLRSIIVSITFSAALAGGAMAGDTVTVNIPGGAGQAILSGVVGLGLNGGVIVGIQPQASTGNYVITTETGAVYTVSSAFIANLIGSYSSR